jgi:hypothetical protein
MMRRLTMAGVLLASTAFAACDDRNNETRTFRLDHMSPHSAGELVAPYVPAGSTLVRVSQTPAAITISASRERLEQIEEMLERLDVAAPSVQLRFQLIEADGFTTTDPAIADVEAALRELFRFQGYRLVADALVTTAPFNSAEQRLLGFDDTPLTLQVSVGQVNRSESAASVQLNVRLVGQNGQILGTGVVVPGGQTVVLGTARPDQSRGALILVVRPIIQ